MTTARRLAEWAHEIAPTPDDEALAERSLRDTVAVAAAATGHPLLEHARLLNRAGRWAAGAHVLDFDDLHMSSTAHISAVIVPATLATGGDARTYLAGAGVMARLGSMLGWQHYQRGWHATCCAGAPGAAVAASLAMGLDPEQTAHAVVLALPGAGGVQRAFGTDAKALQVGMATDAGVRAAALAANGARAEPSTLDQWLDVVGAQERVVDVSGPAVPGGLAMKLFPCCYAMQRPIHAVRAAVADVDVHEVMAVSLRTTESTVQPLIHHRPTTGLEAKFSLEYAVAAALLDGFPSFDSFTDRQVRRPDVAAIIDVVSVELEPGGYGLLDGVCEVGVSLCDGRSFEATVDQPPGSPSRPASNEDLEHKAAGCGPGVVARLTTLDWSNAAAALDDATAGRA